MTSITHRRKYDCSEKGVEIIEQPKATLSRRSRVDGEDPLCGLETRSSRSTVVRGSC